MKKMSFLFAVCSVLYLSIMASGCSKDLNYVKACEEKDWAKAYAIVDDLREDYEELKEDYSYYSHSSDVSDMRKSKELDEKCDHARAKYHEAKKYVVFHEAMYVLEENGENGLLRIAGIIKEHNAKWLYRELIDVARKTSNKDLEEKLIEMEYIEIEAENPGFKDLPEDEKEEGRHRCEDGWDVFS